MQRFKAMHVKVWRVLLNKNVRRMGATDFGEVLGVFRGKELKKWQVEKLKAGEVAYVDRPMDREWEEVSRVLEV